MVFIAVDADTRNSGVKSLIEFLQHPWFLGALLLTAPTLTKNIGTFVHFLVERKTPKNSPLKPNTAGEWATAQLNNNPAIANISIIAQPGPFGNIDAYWPAKRVLMLRPTTFSSRDRAAYNIAAHEIGHALTQGHHPKWGLIFQWARLGIVLLSHLLIAVVLTQLFVVELASWTLHAIFFPLALCHLIILFDEAAASSQAHRLLKHAKLDPATAHLLTAWSAYALHFLGRIVQWVCFPILLALPTPYLSPADLPFKFTPTVFLLILSLALLKRTFRLGHRVFATVQQNTLTAHRTQMKREAIGSFFGGLGVALFVFFFTHAPPILIVLALFSAAFPMATAGAKIIEWPFRTLKTWFPRNEESSQDLPHEERQAPTMSLALLSEASSFRRLFAAVQASYLPLIIFWWIHTASTLSL